MCIRVDSRSSSSVIVCSADLVSADGDGLTNRQEADWGTDPNDDDTAVQTFDLRKFLLIACTKLTRVLTNDLLNDTFVERAGNFRILHLNSRFGLTFLTEVSRIARTSRANRATATGAARTKSAIIESAEASTATAGTCRAKTITACRCSC